MLLQRSRTFRRLWLGQSVSVIGDGMQRIALLWWAKHHGGNALLVAVALSTIIPVVVASPMGGWLADHRDRRLLMLGADLARLGTTSVLAILLLGGQPSAVVVCAMVALAGLATAVFDPTYAATVPMVVDPADLPAANGLNMANSAVGGLIGPLLGGVLIAALDLGWVMVINAATFAWSAACIAATRLPRTERETGSADAAPRSMSVAIALIRNDPMLRRLIALGSALNMVVAPVPMLIVALAVDRFRATPTVFGALEIMVSTGVLIGALAAPRLARGALATPMVVLGLCIAAAGSLPVFGSAAAFVVAGLTVAVANTILMTALQLSVPDEMRGQVFGVMGSLGEGLRPVGLALGAPLLAFAGVSGAFAIVGAGVISATLAWGRPALLSGTRPVSASPVELGVAERPSDGFATGVHAELGVDVLEV